MLCTISFGFLPVVFTGITVAKVTGQFGELKNSSVNEKQVVLRSAVLGREAVVFPHTEL
jgi:hypothetical protein